MMYFCFLHLKPLTSLAIEERWWKFVDHLEMSWFLIAELTGRGLTLVSSDNGFDLCFIVVYVVGHSSLSNWDTDGGVSYRHLEGCWMAPVLFWALFLSLPVISLEANDIDAFRFLLWKDPPHQVDFMCQCVWVGKGAFYSVEFFSQCCSSPVHNHSFIL